MSLIFYGFFKKKSNLYSGCFLLTLFIISIVQNISAVPLPEKLIEITQKDYENDVLKVRGSYYLDTSKKMTIKSIEFFNWQEFNQKEKYFKKSKRIDFFSISDAKQDRSNIWKLLKIKNNTQTNLSLYISGIDEAYQFQDNGKYKKINFQSSWERWRFLLSREEDRSFLYRHSFIFVIPIGATITIVTKKEINNNNEFASSFTLLNKEEDFIKDKFNIRSLNWLLLGAIVILLLYNLLIFLVLRKKIHIYFFVYLLGMLLFNIDQNLLLSLFGEIINSFEFNIFLIIVGLVGYILFVRNFFNSSVFRKGFFLKHPIKAIAIWFIVAQTLMLISDMVSNTGVDSVLLGFLDYAVLLIFLGLILFCFLIFIAILFRVIKLTLLKEPNAFYVLLGNSSVIIASTISVLNSFFDFFDYYYNSIVFSSGFFAEGLIFSVGISRQINQLQNEKEQEQLRSIFTLESKVQERTSELLMEKLIVQEKNREILDSIEYAKRIQTAILPPPRIVKEFLKNSFILYLPKDIVAGDFYWMESIDNTIYFAACDCTGHGVPGAMVSVVCNNALNRSVNEFGERLPGKIFDKTRELVLENFAKSDEEVNDGMDASLCALDVSTGKLYWCGANNPLWIYRAASKSLEEIKPDKQAIGRGYEGSLFTTHELQLQKGDTLYLFTDGYADQFGGEKGKKLTKARFREILVSMIELPMDVQREKLLAQHDAWRGKLEQVDDICVMGVRV